MAFPQKILLVEHEPHLTALVGSALQANGKYLLQRETYNLRILRAALHFQPDLMLLDAPPDPLKLDEIVRQIHANAFLNEVPIICLNTLAPDGKMGSIGFFNGYTFVADPLQLGDLLVCIKEILKGQRPFGAAA
jgi:DNA-binding response OmpR family regulator